MTTSDSFLSVGLEAAIKAQVCLGRKLALVGLMMCYCYRPESGPVINTVKGVLINLATLTIIFTREGEELLSVYWDSARKSISYHDIRIIIIKYFLIESEIGVCWWLSQFTWLSCNNISISLHSLRLITVVSPSLFTARLYYEYCWGSPAPPSCASRPPRWCRRCPSPTPPGTPGAAWWSSSAACSAWRAPAWWGPAPAGCNMWTLVSEIIQS